jgi:hypothetical protein
MLASERLDNDSWLMVSDGLAGESSSYERLACHAGLDFEMFQVQCREDPACNAFNFCGEGGREHD